MPRHSSNQPNESDASPKGHIVRFQKCKVVVLFSVKFETAKLPKSIVVIKVVTVYVAVDLGSSLHLRIGQLKNV